MEYNGGSVVAMLGKDCVAIACDLRLGAQATGVAMNFEKVFPVNDTLYYGLPGLATDVYTLCVSISHRSYGRALTRQERAAALPSQHVPHEGGARDHPGDVHPPLVQYAVREAVRAILHRASRCRHPQGLGG